MKSIMILLALLLIPYTAPAQRHTPAGKRHKHRGVIAPPPPPLVYTFVDQPAEFRGDITAYFRSNLRYPYVAKEYEEEGRTVVLFEVGKDGNVRFLKFARSSGSSALDAEARRLVTAMPAWRPAKSEGRPVRRLVALPVEFHLE